MDKVLFDDASVLFRTVSVGLLAYAVLLLLLRAGGQRTLSKLNAFDLVVTVALGSTLASVLVSRDVALAQGATALALLVGVQFAITWSSVRVRWIRRLVTGEPVLLLHRGAYLEDALRRARVTEDEVRAAVRGQGFLDLAAVEAVVLETDGSLSVLPRGEARRSSLAGVQAPDDAPDRGDAVTAQGRTDGPPAAGA